MGWEININRCPPIVYNTSTVVFTATAKPEPSRQKQNTSWQKQNTSWQKQILHGKSKNSQQEEKRAAKANTCTVPELGGGKPGTQGSRKGCWAWVQIQHGGIQ